MGLKKSDITGMPSLSYPGCPHRHTWIPPLSYPKFLSGIQKKIMDSRSPIRDACLLEHRQVGDRCRGNDRQNVHTVQRGVLRRDSWV